MLYAKSSSTLCEALSKTNVVTSFLVLQSPSTNALQWDGVRGIFYILIGGMCVGLVSSFSEMFYASKKEAEELQVL